MADFKLKEFCSVLILETNQEKFSIRFCMAELLVIVIVILFFFITSVCLYIVIRLLVIVIIYKTGALNYAFDVFAL